MPQSPLLTVNNTILWLKASLTLLTIGLLYARYRRGKSSGVLARTYSLRTKVTVVLVVLFSFGVFHNLGTLRGGAFVHHGEMFHYYLGTKYFKELGYYRLYDAVIVADAEQGNSLAGLPFYTDLKTYQNIQRETALNDAGRIRALFAKERWNAFKDDVAFFNAAPWMPRSPGLSFLLMDHGYNGSPVSTLILGALTNLVPVTQLNLLASIDVFLVIAMGVLVFQTFGFETGALFSVYFCVNILNDPAYVSGSLLRYDWLFYLVVAVCLLERGRYASSALFLTLSSMMRLFPALSFYGMAVAIFQKVRLTRAFDRKHVRFIAAAAVTGLALFLLPATSLGSVLQPWRDFLEKTELHDGGVYVNHLGLRGIVLFEPSHLSLEKFVEAYSSSATPDLVRHWQDVKESEFRQKRWVTILASVVAAIFLTVVFWRRRAAESENILWPLLLVYTLSYPSHYYYAFLCLFALLYFRRPNSLSAFVPMCLLLSMNLVVLVTDYFRPSPIVFYTLVNVYLFICWCSILCFELYSNVLKNAPISSVAGLGVLQEPAPDRSQPPRRTRVRRR